MASDTEPTDSAPPSAPDDARTRLRRAAARARARQRRARALRSARGGWRGAIDGFGAASARMLDGLAANDGRRRIAAILAAFAINLSVLTVLAVFGKVRIWLPNAPRQTISVVLVNEPEEPLIPELRNPEIAPEPKPEPKPEIVEKPDLELKPEPKPEPEAKPEPELEPAPAPEPEPEPKPEPNPVLDLTPDEIFAAPGEPEPEPLIPEAAPQTAEDQTAPAPAEEEPQPAGPEEEETQSPVEEAPPLVEAQPTEAEKAGIEELKDDQNGEDQAGKDEEKAGPDEILETPPGEPVANDDMFDQDPFMSPSRLPLPDVDLPEGESASNPGSSGVVAIYCPEQFTNPDKVAECAGRVEIRSGWRPGASGEDWSEAVRLMRADREHGTHGGGGDLSTVVGPEKARQIKDAETVRDITDFRRAGVDAEMDPVGPISDVNIGPAPIEPNWTKRDDPNFTEKDLRKLDEELKKARDAKDVKKIKEQQQKAGDDE